jgi:RimJ/RimL family protein N-acetyltransferase
VAAHKPMTPPGHLVPERVVTDRFVVRPLTVDDVEADYDAWSTSIEHLRGIFGPGSHWPDPGMTLEDNRIDLAWHQREFGARSSFAYTVLGADERTCVGCCYLDPARKAGFDAEAHYWVRASEAGTGLDDALGRWLRGWLAAEWPFEHVAFPGRDVGWAEYAALPDQPHW